MNTTLSRDDARNWVRDLVGYYCVLASDGQERYAGRSMDKAARFLQPGTVYGYGLTEPEARGDAIRKLANSYPVSVP